VPKTPEWKEDEKAQIAFNEISKLYQQNHRAMVSYKEAQLEDNFIRPVLKALGHFFGIQGRWLIMHVCLIMPSFPLKIALMKLISSRALKTFI